MLYAKTDKGKDVEPIKHGRAICPGCGGEVIAKCGSQNVWHWSHIVLDCDRWTEPESPWHKNWKEIVPRENREIKIGAHRADIRLDSGLVVELQNSSISGDEIHEREQFYQNMVWIFNATKFAKNCILAECSKSRGMSKPRYRSSGKDFRIFSRIDGYLKLVNFQMEQESVIAQMKADHFSQNRSKKGQSGFLSSNSQGAGSLVSDLCFDHKSYVPFVGKLETIESPCFPDRILARPVYFRWRWIAGSLTRCQKPVFWDVGSDEALIFFPNGIEDIISRAKDLFDRRKLERPSDLCAWVVPKREVLNYLVHGVKHGIF